MRSASRVLSVLLLGAILAAGCGSGRESAAQQGQIVFVGGKEGRLELYVIRPDGSGLRRLTHNQVDDVNPSWSPDGDQIVFARAQRSADGFIERSSLHALDVRSGRETQLTSGEFVDGDPAWSPTSNTIAFSRNAAGDAPSDWDLYTVDETRHVQRMKYDLSGHELHPAWTPDGKALTFAYDADYHGERTNLWTLEPGHAPTTTEGTDTGLYQWDPDWSSQGELAFSVIEDPGYIFVVVRGREWSCCDPTRHTSEPSWSPDGTELVVDAGNDHELLILDRDGSIVRRVQVPPAEFSNPDWGP